MKTVASLKERKRERERPAVRLRYKANQAHTGLYAKNYNMLIKETKDNPQKWREVHAHRMEDSTVRRSNSPKVIYRINSVSKIPAGHCSYR